MAHRHDHCSISGCDEPGSVMITGPSDAEWYFCLCCGGIVRAALDIMEARQLFAVTPADMVEDEEE